MSVAEYLYIDKRRVDSYFEQLSDTDKTVTIPTWKFSLGLSGPRLERAQSHTTKPYSRHEKIKHLMEKLDIDFKGGITGYSVFGFNSFAAKRVLIPRTASKRDDFRGLAIWIARSNLGGIYLNLLEDYPRDDEEINTISAGSTFWILLQDLSEELAKTKAPSARRLQRQQRDKVIHKTNLPRSFYDELVKATAEDRVQRLRQLFVSAEISLPESATIECENPQSFFGPTKIYVPFQVRDRGFVMYSMILEQTVFGSLSFRITHVRRTEFGSRFDLSPEELFSSWGAIAGPERQVDCLYRVRTRSIGDPSILAYPIFICDHPSPFSH